MIPTVLGIGFEKNNLQHRDPSLSRIDPFGYNVHSITHYGIPASLLRKGETTSESTTLLEEDKAFITYLYPKPCGGTIDLGPNINPGSISGNRSLDALQKSIPRVVMGITDEISMY